MCGNINIAIHGRIDGKTDKTYLTIFHLTVLTFLAIPVGNIIIPLIMWINKKDKIIYKVINREPENIEILHGTEDEKTIGEKLINNSS